MDGWAAIPVSLYCLRGAVSVSVSVPVSSWKECRRQNRKGKKVAWNDNYETDREKKERVGVVCKQRGEGCRQRGCSRIAWTTTTKNRAVQIAASLLCYLATSKWTLGGNPCLWSCGLYKISAKISYKWTEIVLDPASANSWINTLLMGRALVFWQYTISTDPSAVLKQR